MPSQIELYEEMSLLSSRMAAAARASDWQHLIELEHGIRKLRDALLAISDDGHEAVSKTFRITVFYLRKSIIFSQNFSRE